MFGIYIQHIRSTTLKQTGMPQLLHPHLPQRTNKLSLCVLFTFTQSFLCLPAILCAEGNEVDARWRDGGRVVGSATSFVDGEMFSEGKGNRVQFLWGFKEFKDIFRPRFCISGNVFRNRAMWCFRNPGKLSKVNTHAFVAESQPCDQASARVVVTAENKTQHPQAHARSAVA